MRRSIQLAMSPFIARISVCLVSFVLSISLLSTSALAYCKQCVYPAEHWQVLTNKELPAYGWSVEKLNELTDYLKEKSNATGIVVVDRGRVVYTYGNVNELSYVASVRKSILAMLYGQWVLNNTIDLSKTLAELQFDDVGGLLPIERTATIDNIISARSGIYHIAANTGDDTDYAPTRGSKQPGTYMLYNNWDFNAAGGLFELLTKRNIYDELERQLAVPLQFEDWDRSKQDKRGRTSKSKYLAYHMWLSTRDMARIGYLMLNNGLWKDKQLIPATWVKQITQVVTPLAQMNPDWRRDRYFGYGKMWWVWDGPRAVGPFKGAYTARGAHGQWISVFPAIDLVIAHKTNDEIGLNTSWSSWQHTIERLFVAKDVDMLQPYPWKK